jgi:hypothetical protein
MKHTKIKTAKERKVVIEEIAKMVQSTMEMYAREEAKKIVDNVLMGLNIDMTREFTIRGEIKFTGAHIVQIITKMRRGK